MTSDLQTRIPAGPATVDRRAFSPPGGQPTGGHHQPTVMDLLRILWRRLWVVVLIVAAAIATAVYVTHRTPPTWQAHAQMILVQHASAVEGPQPVVETVETQMTMLQDQEMDRRALAHLTSAGHSAADLGVDAAHLAPLVTVSNPGSTDLIDLYVKGGDPGKAALLTDGICQAFMTWKKEIAQHNSEESLTNLEVRANRAKVELNAAEQAELHYRKAHQLIDVAAQSGATLSQSLATDAQVTSLQQEMALDKAKLANLGARLQNVDQAIRSGTSVRDDSLVMTLQSQLNQLEIQRAQQALKYTADFPGVLPDLDAQIKDIRARLTKAVRGILDNKPFLQTQGQLKSEFEAAQTDILLTQAKLTGVEKIQAQLKAQLPQLPQRTLDDQRLTRNADLARGLYTSLQSALNAANLEKDNATSNVQIVQTADVDPKPIDPNPLRNLMTGAAVGIVLSLAAVMLLEQADRRVRDFETLRPLAFGPIIGALPQMSRAQVAALREGRPGLPDAEAYSMASANLGLTLQWAAPTEDWNHRVVMVTSAMPGEGKSVTSAALARSLAQTGKKVALVNADMRRPALDKLFPTEETVGLADVLEGTVALEDALQPSDLHNLWILHSGNVASSPTALISRPQMRETLDALKQVADIVLIDTPACSVVADALLLAPHADCILYVVGAGQVDQEMVRSATASLSAASPKAFAYVMNRMPRSRRYGYQQYYRQVSSSLTEHAQASGQMILTRTMELRGADLAQAVQGNPAETPSIDATGNGEVTHE